MLVGDFFKNISNSGLDPDLSVIAVVIVQNKKVRAEHDL